ncbi:MAG: DNA-directed DNA polymerase [Tepidiforma sp.]|uniref:DNA polymerase III subunit alpha n=1 Tax=Tepidiforma sp. TaxID=2682230 RepID=UPI0021DBF070|nr:DNA polymerase III subunit alpha [Tepidiforma sp.]GIW14568.1 MAG: DNA-directed DNA polymerase [Tepidiforma sp.]
MFTHLHTHTEYSLLDGMSKIGPLMDRVKALGQVAIAMTDHGALYGAIDFYREATARGIKPIIGVEAYVAPGSRFSREKSESSPYHLVLLARNLAGYKNLIALVTKANLEGYYYKPRIDRELIEKHCEGLTVLSGCPSSEFHRRVQEGDREGAIAVAKYYREVFDGHYYLEVQDHGDEKFTRLNPVIADIGRELGIPVVATNDSHYTFPEDAEAHDILLCIGTNATVDQRDRYRFDGHGYYLKSEEEMLRLFPENPEFITNTMLVADECDLELKFDRQLLPEPPVPPGRTSDDYLAELCFRGLRERFEVVTPELEERLRYELDVLRQTGFTDYMFVVKEIADYARKSGIRMGVRGSAAASLVLYVLKVTDIDPVANRLVFERFLNIERREMPDVDFDFADDRRDEMIRFAYERYGRDRVAQIITFGTLGAKAAIRDVGRALGLSYAETDRVARLVPDVLHITLPEALEQSPELREAYEGDPKVRRLVDTAKRLEGVARHASTHAAGVVISRDPLIEHVPLQRPTRGDEDSIPMTQFAMEQVAKIGLLKMDFLGLSNLTILQRATDLIRETTGEAIDLVRLPDGDPKTMEMLGKGETFGVFQLESAGMRRYIQELQPTNIADLCAMVALYRPGPMQHIPRYIDGKHGRVPITYPHPDLADILDETYGVIVYQDQVLLIARKFAGYTLGQADIMRKAMGKKKAEIMAEERGRFIAGAVAKGYREEDARAVFDLIEPFAGYAFNKAHSWCYGHIAYQTAYLKANYPVQYMTALLQLAKNAPDTHARIAAAVAECSKLGIEVLPPDVNASQDNFSVERRPDGSMAIRFGLGVIKNVGSAAVEGIIAAREQGGPYRDIEDFCRRADLSSANSRVLEHLAKAGAFDMLGGPPGPYNRATLAAHAERLIGLAKRERELRESGQATMFDLFGSQVETPLPALDLEPVPQKREDLLAWEKELLGVYVSDHPFKSVAPEVARYTTHSLADLGPELAGQTVTIAGMLTRVQARFTRDGRKFYLAELEDLSGTAELTVWSDTIELTGEEAWAEGRVLVCSVEVRDRGDRGVSYSVRKAAPFDPESGTAAGFAANQWQVEAAPRRAAPAPAAEQTATRGNGQGPARPQANGSGGNGNGGYRAAGPTAEASRPGVTPPVEGEAVRLAITLIETDDVLTDEALLKAVVELLKRHPGRDEVRVVIRDTAGEETEFDFPRANATEELARSLRNLVGNRGTVRLTGGAKVAGAA